ELVLALMPRPATLKAAVEHVRQQARQAKNSPTMNNFPRLNHEILAVPMLTLGIERNFEELVGKPLLNSGWEQGSIIRALQAIRFRLDQRGAVLESEAILETMKSERNPAEVIRRFVFDRPFLLYLKERDSSVPYFALWVETPEVMQSALG